MIVRWRSFRARSFLPRALTAWSRLFGSTTPTPTPTIATVDAAQIARGGAAALTVARAGSAAGEIARAGAAAGMIR